MKFNVKCEGKVNWKIKGVLMLNCRVKEFGKVKVS
jgi:hypothetical protein